MISGPRDTSSVSGGDVCAASGSSSVVVTGTDGSSLLGASSKKSWTRLNISALPAIFRDMSANGTMVALMISLPAMNVVIGFYRNETKRKKNQESICCKTKHFA